MKTIIILSLSILVSILILYAETSANQYIRQKFIFAYFVGAIIEAIVGFNIFEGRIERSIFIYSFVGVFLPPYLIAHLINYTKNKEKVIAFKLALLSKGYFIFLIILWIALIYVNIFSTENISQNNFDNFAEYFIYTYGYSLLALVNIIYFYISAFQSIRIYEEGLFFSGFLWKWSDFHSYSIEVMAKNKKISKVTLNLAKKIWIPIDDIFLSIPTENGEKLDTWLSKKLPRA